jgi:lactate dehydrogenase-like 2-hydroxyacid dehydrogenase
MKNKLLIITPVSHIDNFLTKARKSFLVTYMPNINEKNLKKNLFNKDYLFTNPNMSKIFLGKELIKKSNLKAICTASTGTNHIDIKTLKNSKIKLLSLTKQFKIIKQLTSTAELAFGLTLNAVRNISISSESVKKGKWSYLPYVGRMMKNLKICTIGYGRLGKIYSNYCLSFGASVSAYDPFVKIKDKRIKIIKNLKSSLNKFDIISLNIHASQDNINFLDKNIFKYLKKNIILINTSRGEIVNEKDLLIFLKKNIYAKYFTDVVSNEQKKLKNNAIIKKFKTNSSQIMVTPHIGGMTSDGQKLAYDHALNMLIKYDKKNA